MSEKNKKRKRVLVISRNYNNLLTMARSLAGGDYDIEAVRLIQLKYKVMKLLSKSNPERASKYISRYYICQTNWNPDAFVKFLLEIHDPERETLLVPCDDLALPWIDDNYDLLKEYYLISNVDQTSGKLAQLMNKQYQKKLALDFGLTAAKSHNINIREGQYSFPDGIDYPCFVKPATLIMGGKDYLKKYDDEKTLISALDSMASKFKDVDVLVEDFINIKNEYALLGLCADDNVIIPNGILHSLEGGHGSRTGIMAKGDVVTSPEICDFIEELKQFMRSLNYTGLFDIDILGSDEKLHFCELNLRFGGSGYAITKAGVNLPRMYADYMLHGKSLTTDCVLDGIGKTFVSEKIILEDCTEGFITKQEAKSKINSADIHFIIDEEDQGPYKMVMRDFKYTAKIMMSLKNLYKKLKHR